MHEVHEVKENLKLNLANNGSTVKCKYFGCIGKTSEYNDTDSFEFWSKLMILIKLYRQHAGNKTYKVNTNHANWIQPYGECSRVICSLLILIY